MKKLQLVYLRDKGMGCIPHAHYDLCTLEKAPKNVACILTGKEGATLIKKWIKKHNKESLNKEVLKEYKHNYYVKNKKRLRKIQKEYTDIHKEEKRNYDKLYNAKNKDKRF